MKDEILLHWLAVAGYSFSTVAFIYSLFFKKRTYRAGLVLATAGFLFHTAALGLRWYHTGHGPYMRVYEVYSSDVWVAVLMYLIIQFGKPKLRVFGSFVMPSAVLLIGMAIMASKEIRELPESFRTFWLILHIFFAKLAYGSLLIATAAGVLYLLKADCGIRKSEWLKKIPDNDYLDELNYKFTGFGFFNLTVMIAAGSIWANQAWGSYWSWDPVEVWSLISWFIYAIYLHLRRMHGWRGSRAAWFSVAAFAILVFTIIGVGLIYVSNHSPYIS